MINSKNDWFRILHAARQRSNGIDVSLFDECKAVAESGDPKAQAELSLMLYGGEGTAMNLPEAFKWLDKAAQSDPIQLNMTYKIGREYNLPSAYFGLFVMWETGIGVPQDDDISIKNLRLAAEHGYAAAMDEIGSRHHIGLYGFEHDDQEAEKWFLKAIHHGSTSSEGALSNIYTRRGNFEKAFYYLEQACHHDGYSVFYKELAQMYLEAKGIELDNVNALKWYYVAAVQTDFYDNDILNLKCKMTEMEVNLAIEEAKTWLSENEKNLPRFKRVFDSPIFL